MDGRRAEYERLLSPLLPSLYHAALGFLRHRDDAEDAVAETAIRAYRAFDSFEAGTNFKAWVFRILTNYCINAHRKREREPERVAYEDVERQAEAAGSALAGEAALTEVRVLDGVLDEEVELALRALPEDYRTVAVLADIHEFSYDEIATMIGAPIGTVRSRLFRARRLLRLALADYARERGLLREEDSV